MERNHLKPAYASGCDVGKTALVQSPAPKTTGLETVPLETLQAMKAYAAKLKRNSPGMTEARVTRKVCEKFKVKLQ